MLPTLVTPEFETKLFDGTKVKYRPFLVKEMKNLLIASNTKDVTLQWSAIKKILVDCVLSGVIGDIEDLPIYDIEKLFMDIRSVSVGEKISVVAKCKSCGGENEQEIDISNLKAVAKEGHTNKVKLTDGIGLIMMYPTMRILSKYLDKVSDPSRFIDIQLDVLIDCVQSVWDKEHTYSNKDFTRKEIEVFFNNMNKTQLDQVVNFANTMPKVTCNVDFKCKKCQVDNHVSLEGLNDFFT